MNAVTAPALTGRVLTGLQHTDVRKAQIRALRKADLVDTLWQILQDVDQQTRVYAHRSDDPTGECVITASLIFDTVEDAVNAHQYDRTE